MSRAKSKGGYPLGAGLKPAPTITFGYVINNSDTLDLDSTRLRLALGRSPLGIDPNRHAAGHSFSRDRSFIRLSDVQVLVYVRDRPAAITRVYGASVRRGVTGCSALAKARSVRTVKDQQPKPIGMGAEVLVEPVPLSSALR
jgi:hypothetical protein